MNHRTHDPVVYPPHDRRTARASGAPGRMRFRAGEAMRSCEIAHADAIDYLRSLPDASVDAVVTDPPYPEIDRPYGRLTEPTWHELMDGVAAETRRVLKPGGSAVFFLQPNSERVGRVRPWLWEFMARQARGWNMVQEAWWLNTRPMPGASANRRHGLMRGALKACVWLGDPSCWRDQSAVLWTAAMEGRVAGLEERRTKHPSGHSVNRAAVARAVAERGGSTPYNVYPCPAHSEGHGHPAATPAELTAWWVRYIAPAGGVVLDPFTGSGTTAREALRQGRDFVGSERDPEYFDLAQRRVRDLARDLGMEAIAA